MKVKIVSIGKPRTDFIRDGEAEYLKRIKPYLKLHLVELPDVRPGSMAVPQRISKESDSILLEIEKGDYLIALDSKGKSFESESFAKFLEKRLAASQPLAFAIGGADGHGEKVKERADLTLSLSAFTFTHEMSRLILLEQLYRALSIMRNLPYHK